MLLRMLLRVLSTLLFLVASSAGAGGFRREQLLTRLHTGMWLERSENDTARLQQPFPGFRGGQRSSLDYVFRNSTGNWVSSRSYRALDGDLNASIFLLGDSLQRSVVIAACHLRGTFCVVRPRRLNLRLVLTHLSLLLRALVLAHCSAPAISGVTDATASALILSRKSTSIVASCRPPFLAVPLTQSLLSQLPLHHRPGRSDGGRPRRLDADRG
jgi:hypothetical protein